MCDRLGNTTRDAKEQSKSPTSSRHHLSRNRPHNQSVHSRQLSSTQRDDVAPKQKLILRRKSISKKSLNPSKSDSLPKFLQDFDEKLNTQRVMHQKQNSFVPPADAIDMDQQQVLIPNIIQHANAASASVNSGSRERLQRHKRKNPKSVLVNHPLEWNTCTQV